MEFVISALCRHFFCRYYTTKLGGKNHEMKKRKR